MIIAVSYILRRSQPSLCNFSSFTKCNLICCTMSCTCIWTSSAPQDHVKTLCTRQVKQSGDNRTVLFSLSFQCLNCHKAQYSSPQIIFVNYASLSVQLATFKPPEEISDSYIGNHPLPPPQILPAAPSTNVYKCMFRQSRCQPGKRGPDNPGSNVI